MTARIARLALFAMLWAAPAIAQFGGVPGSSRPAATPEPAQEPDPYGRETPRGSFLGFIQAAQKGNIVVASEYLEWPVRGVRGTRVELAQRLKYVLDVGFEGRLMTISESPQGDLEDGLPPGHERIGHIEAGGDRVDVILVRRAQRDGSHLWFISSGTLREVPNLYDRVGFPDVERRLPPAFVETTIGGLALWKLLAILLVLPVLYVATWFLLTGIVFVTRKLRRRADDAVGAREWATAVRAPLSLLIALVLTGAFLAYIRIPIVSRYWAVRIMIPLFFLGVVWLVFRALDVAARQISQRIAASGAGGSRRGLGFGLRVVKVVVFGLAILAILGAYGVNLTATLAGVGIGGIALAFAAQKSLENLFGGFMVLGGGAIRIGDVCRIGQHLGQVEDITLTATQLRTNDRTVVTIPNGQMATERVENLSRRDKFWFRHIVGVRYDTTPEQLERVLKGWREMFAADPRVDPSIARARLVKFGASSLDVELFAYVRAESYDEFLAAQEQLLKRTLAVASAAKVEIAFPSTTVYLETEDPSSAGAVGGSPQRGETTGGGGERTGNPLGPIGGGL